MHRVNWKSDKQVVGIKYPSKVVRANGRDERRRVCPRSSGVPNSVIEAVDERNGKPAKAKSDAQ